jgi:hypothetical protein
MTDLGIPPWLIPSIVAGGLIAVLIAMTFPWAVILLRFSWGRRRLSSRIALIIWAAVSGVPWVAALLRFDLGGIFGMVGATFPAAALAFFVYARRGGDPARVAVVVWVALAGVAAVVRLLTM